MSGSSKWIFKLHCGEGKQHYGCFTIGAVDRKQSTLQCYICSPTLDVHPSSYELEAYATIELAIKTHGMTPGNSCQEAANAMSLWVREAKVVPSKPQSPVDIYFKIPNLCIQIDGSQHFADGMKKVTLIEQQRRDSEFDAAAWNDNCRLLRVHYRDMQNFEDYLFEAVQFCLEHPTQRLIKYSHSWPLSHRHPGWLLTV